MNKYKKCCKCKKFKLLSKFFKNKNRKDKCQTQCKVCAKKYKKIYRIKNKERIARRIHKYYEEHKKEVKEYSKKWHQRNKARINQNHKKRYHIDMEFKIQEVLRSRFYRVLNGKCKSISAILLLGCSVEFLKKHLESQFKSGMAWGNYGRGGWEIDHIKPCAKFDLTKESEQCKCFHYTNLQPLWWNENRSKGSKTLN